METIRQAVTEVNTLGQGRRPITTVAGRVCGQTGVAARFGVVLRADPANTEPIYVGGANVTPGTSETTDGFPLYPGETLSLQIGDPHKLYAIAPTTAQYVFALWH